jgi:DNA-binding transcriptional MocR family regulator
MRNYYRQKRDRLLGALRKSRLGDCLSVRGADAGLHFLITVNAGCSEEELTQCARDKGIRIFGLTHYEALPGQEEDAFSRRQGYASVENGRGESRPCMVVNYPGLTDEQIDALPDLLLEAWTGLSGLPCL